MRKERRKNVPVCPPTLLQMADTLAEYPPVNGTFKGCVQSNDGGCALIFLHQSMEEPLRRCTQLYADGTFKVYLSF